ncbi:MAG TPA: SdpI family protein [Gemmatimonadales bacterium]|nr:SdpI family protein [Gemmatimonadales bacterium]
MRKLLPAISAVILVLAFSLWALPQLPDRMATHWGLSGQPDGWSSRAFAAFMLPAVMAAMTIIFAFLPRIDPLRRNYEIHGSTYWTLVNSVVVFMVLVHVAVLGNGLGWPIPMGRVAPAGVGALFVLIGNLMTRMRPNWFMGIRTPWTLSSERVWRKTHRVGGYAFTAGGLLMILIAFVSGRRIVPMLLGIVGVIVIWPVVYSYLEWRKEQEEVGHRVGGSAGQQNR